MNLKQTHAQFLHPPECSTCIKKWVLRPISCINNYMRVLISIHLNTYQRSSANQISGVRGTIVEVA